MKIDLRKILKDETTDISFEFDYNIELDKQFEAMGIIKATPIHVNGKVVALNSKLFLEIKLEGEITFLCTRCLEETKYCFDRNLNKMLQTDETDEADVIVFKDNYLDLCETILEEIILNLPARVICDDNCKGLCPICGINRNHASCNCEDEKVDPRFDVLDKFFS